MREDPLINGQYYHILTKSIAGFVIYNNDFEYRRMMLAIQFYQFQSSEVRFSKLIEKIRNHQLEIEDVVSDKKFVDIVSFCLMPTHLHFTLKQTAEKGISIFMNRLLNSYSRYFNTLHNRKGPLWEARFKSVLIKDESQLLHLTRYHHLNPVSAGLIVNPEDWQYSSYAEYVGKTKQRMCNFDIININNEKYEKFVNERIDYQKELSKIKKLILD